MDKVKDKIGDISKYLQYLTEESILSEVQAAIEKKDKNMLADICKKIKIPEIYINTIASILFSATPQQKWPALY